MVAMDPQDIPRGRTSPLMGRFRMWTMDALWAFGLRRFWQSTFTNQADELLAWIPMGIWTIRQLSQRLEAKGSCGNIHGWFKDGDFGWDPHVSTANIKKCYPLCEDERWPTSETKEVHTSYISSSTSKSSNVRSTCHPSLATELGGNAVVTSLRFMF